MVKYTDSFYADQEVGSLLSAVKVLDLIRPQVSSRCIVDVGCGVGAWLKVCLDLGAREVLGIDGKHVPLDRMMIPLKNYLPADLLTLPDLGRKFDVAISVEVIEHFSIDFAVKFISYLTSLSDFILFSGAIPYQGGTGHVNENWHFYWSRLFAEQGYELYDIIRPVLWGDEDVDFWYKQNTFVFALPERAERAALGLPGPRFPLDAVHPELYLLMASKAKMGNYELDKAQLNQVFRWYKNGGSHPELKAIYGTQNENNYDGWVNYLKRASLRLRKHRHV